ncbi:MAG: cation diffusion facilitator family transporter, partial [Endomicrobium sp.]|nr:cation diffusion facilitator family transporter [Endomicrobium sp.]
MQKIETYRAVKLSVVSNTVLAFAKLVIGIAIGSIAIISEAVHSLVDLAASLIAYFSVRKASQPADKIYTYGYDKFENFSASVEGLLIFTAAVYIICHAFEKLFNPSILDAPAAGIIVMFVSAFINFFVSQKLFAVAKEKESLAAEADAWHLRTDVYTSLGVMTALVIMTVSSCLFPSLNVCWIDSLAAFIVAFMIMKTAWNLLAKSARDLFDISLPQNEIAAVESAVKSNKNIIGFHGLRTRKAGNKRFIEFHILVNSEMTVDMSHRITQDLEDGISTKLKNT